jgi:membrane-associated phospholipid phosphatase
MALASDSSALDAATLAYVVFAAVVMTARAGKDALPIALGHLLLGAAALAAGRLRARGGAAGFVGEFYPLLALIGLYGSIGLVNLRAGVAHDATVQRWEAAIFGGQPSRDWIRAQPWPWLSWALHLGYLSYYAILTAGPLGLWVDGRRAGARRVVLAVMGSFYVCYVVFLLFPVAGPRYAFPHASTAATATAVARATERLLDEGAAWGTAFPSSHVAAGLTAAMATFLEWRRLGAGLLVLAVLLTLGTVYGQFHYAVDATTGALVAAGMIALTGSRP